MLSGKKGIIFGIRSQRTIGWSIAKAARENGAELCISYRGDREKDKAVALADSIGAKALPCDVSVDEEITALFETLGQEWGSLDFMVHSIAFAPLEDMQAGMVGTSRDGFSLMNDISAYSLAPLSRAAAPLMTDGGAILALTYEASQRVVPAYAPMSVAKASLECIARYVAYELGEKAIRCNCISAGAVETPAARGIPGFTGLLKNADAVSPLRRGVKLTEIANTAMFLLSDMSSAITGEIVHVDCGMHIL